MYTRTQAPTWLNFALGRQSLAFDIFHHRVHLLWMTGLRAKYRMVLRCVLDGRGKLLRGFNMQLHPEGTVVRERLPPHVKT